MTLLRRCGDAATQVGVQLVARGWHGCGGVVVWLGCEGRGEVMATVDKCGCGLPGSPFTTVLDALLACGPATPAFRKFVRQELWAPCEHCEGEGEDCDGKTVTMPPGGRPSARWHAKA